MFLGWLAGLVIVCFVVVLVQLGVRSRAAGESVRMSFSPSTIQTTSNQDFVEVIKASPSINMSTRGYVFKVTFDPAKVHVKNIEYKLGFVAPVLGDNNETLETVNANGVVRVVSAISEPTGQVVAACTAGASGSVQGVSVRRSEIITKKDIVTKTVCATGTAGQGGCDYIGASGIQEAVDAIPDGGTVLVKNGTYTNVNVRLGYDHPSKHNITIKGESQNAVLDNNNVGDAIHIGGNSSNVVVQSFTVKNSKLNGIAVAQTAQATIQNNLIYDNSQHNNPQAFGGIYVQEESEASIKNNVIYNNSYSGIYVDPQAHVTATNNVLASNNKDQQGQGGYGVKTEVNNFVSRYNLFWANEGVCASNLLWCTAEGSINDQDPKFVTSTDFHLQPDSPAKNAGDPDILDPDGSRSDMGAYGGPGACGLDSNLPGCSGGDPTATPTPTAVPDCGTPVVEITFTSLSTDPANITALAGTFYQIKSNNTLVEIPSVQSDVALNGGLSPTNTPVPSATPTPKTHAVCRHNQCVQEACNGAQACKDKCKKDKDCAAEPTPTKKPTEPAGPTPTPCTPYQWNDVNGNPPCTAVGGSGCSDYGGSCSSGWNTSKFQACQSFCRSYTPTPGGGGGSDCECDTASPDASGCGYQTQSACVTNKDSKNGQCKWSCPNGGPPTNNCEAPKPSCAGYPCQPGQKPVPECTSGGDWECKCS